MSFSETPIFPGKVKNGAVTAAASTIQTVDIFTADATYGGVVKGINLHEKGSSAVNYKLKYYDGSTAYILCRSSTSGVQYTSENILKNSKLPWIDDNDPILRLAPGTKLQLEIENSVANALDIFVQGGTYEYPN